VTLKSDSSKASMWEIKFVLRQRTHKVFFVRLMIIC